MKQEAEKEKDDQIVGLKQALAMKKSEESEVTMLDELAGEEEAAMSAKQRKQACGP